uniref:Uncharacterized protein n=1 Tax=Thermofilum pendens TaxID=2269 RepID=A0A7C1PD34_THEPE
MSAREPIDEWIERHEKEPDVVAKEKAERFIKAVELKVSNRVPVAGVAGDFLCSYTGITCGTLPTSLRRPRLQYSSSYMTFQAIGVSCLLPTC